MIFPRRFIAGFLLTFLLFQPFNGKGQEPFSEIADTTAPTEETSEADLELQTDDDTGSFTGDFSSSTAETERTIDYTTELIEIGEQGLFDTNGRPLLQWETEKAVNSDSKTLTAPEAAETDDIDQDLGLYQQSILSQWGNLQSFNGDRLKQLKDNLQQERQQFKQLGDRVTNLNQELGPVAEKIITLKDQIELYNAQLFGATQQMQKIEQRMVEKQLAIKDLMRQIQTSEVTLKAQRQTVIDFIALMYREEDQYLDLYQSSSSSFKLLLADRSLGESLQGVEYMRFIEQLGRDFYNDLQAQERILIEQQKNLEDQQQEFAALHLSLDEGKEQLKTQQLAKKQLLEQTQGEEQRYQELLEEAIRQQMDSMIAIQNMSDSVGLIEQKLQLFEATLPQDPDIEELQGSFEDDAVLNSTQDQTAMPLLRSYPLQWPVNPERGISAYFHDPNYPKRWGTHQAIDIRVRQGTPIRAPANAYVFETKDNGKGYSYIILAHKGNLVTVYGHVSQILVKPGTIIRKGEVIGLTGGMPGTQGAGLQTTGPHLHLEVYRTGQAIDPLLLLPVFELPFDSIPEKFLQGL